MTKSWKLEATQHGKETRVLGAAPLPPLVKRKDTRIYDVTLWTLSYFKAMLLVVVATLLPIAALQIESTVFRIFTRLQWLSIHLSIGVFSGSSPVVGSGGSSVGSDPSPSSSSSSSSGSESDLGWLVLPKKQLLKYYYVIVGGRMRRRGGVLLFGHLMVNKNRQH